MGSPMGKADKPLTGQLGLIAGFEEVAAHFFETPYEGVRRLMLWLDNHPFCTGLADTWVEPCAGGGAIARHVNRYYDENPTSIGPVNWHLIEMRDEYLTLETVAHAARLESPRRIQDAAGSERDDVLGITNLPWYAETIEVVEGFWNRYPNAWLIGLLCTQFAKDGIRPQWYRKHRPEHILLHAGRMSFAQDGSKYPHAVAWNIWRPGGEPGGGSFDILLPEDTETP